MTLLIQTDPIPHPSLHLADVYAVNGGKEDKMSILKTLTKVKANNLSSELRRRLGLQPGEEVNLTVETITEIEEDPWQAIKGTLSLEEGEELRQLIASNRRSRKVPPQVE